jgi:hypothetical protein
MSRMCTARVQISVTNKTCSRCSQTASACRKSPARTPHAGAAGNCRQAGDGRRGAGQNLAAQDRADRPLPRPVPQAGQLTLDTPVIWSSA